MKTNSQLIFGNSPLQIAGKDITGELVIYNGEEFYKISNFERMPPFFISVVSSSDLWMFVSSGGGLTCGRKHPDNALFPYYTDDKIHDSAETTGPVTHLIIHKQKQSFYWRPFGKGLSVYDIQRNIYKSVRGNKLIFEEINHDLEVVFSYTWMNSDKFGFVRRVDVKNLSDRQVGIDFIDGLRNILPYGVTMGLQNSMSTLVDGYKQSELIEKSGLGIFTLSSILTDRAEPSEALKASVVWQHGISNARYLLSEEQVRFFLSGKEITTETFSKGKRGCFLIQSNVVLAGKGLVTWNIIADIGLGPSDVPNLIHLISSENLAELIQLDIDKGTQELVKLVSQADGVQYSEDKLISTRHFSNSLFNIMRGGIFSDGYLIRKIDFLNFVESWNRKIFAENKGFLKALDEKMSLTDLLGSIQALNNPDLERLTLEYLPLMFSRRHGDPSRPWNVFSIDIKKVDGGVNLYYQGNWRDIFQNWEALSLSYPGYIDSFISKFVNASTADGYNPYRVTRDGFDWETLDPDDPWSNIGYWGDHQVIYLLKMLELSHRYFPGKIQGFLSKEIFVYAHVPYKIKDYDSLISYPRNTIEYDSHLASRIDMQVQSIGADGKLYTLKVGTIYKVNLLEKLLVLLLSKLSNFVPGGGIWMNTQRPEWNDANNALVGYGLSMVTLYYLRRFLGFMKMLLGQATGADFSVSNEVTIFFDHVVQVFEQHKPLLGNTIDDVSRKLILDQLGRAGEEYRNQVYNGLTGQRSFVGIDRLNHFIDLALQFIDHTIRANRRSDGLYHAYNLVHFEDDGYKVRYLYEMLEGQVAILSSGFLDAKESLHLLKSLRSSKLFRGDQNSYMLYPDKKLPGFLEKNTLDPSILEKAGWLKEQLEKGNKEIVEKDINGDIHFNGRYRNSSELRENLQKDPTIAYEEIDLVCRIFEDLFQHRQFTGRSGTFYKYEGLGSIYWHMVSKLLLAVQEVWDEALKDGLDEGQLAELYQGYIEIKAGIGLHKKPEEYGAFPIDPYSHTPSFAGVQQPGMTGQVKEDILCRQFELGVVVSKGIIQFKPSLLKKDELTSKETLWGHGYPERTIVLPEKSLGFTLCWVPVIYKVSDAYKILVEYSSGKTEQIDSNSLDTTMSQQIFMRSGIISKIVVFIPEGCFK
jgi:hypothetical protein